ncbi:hypothetical protein [Nonomuraea sp. NPDC049695]|uniref:hypothetical protein n=1 Tax=Nonomuraea sp. NPDC049695 TaxID=3154734 RepID=UPI003427A273
MVNAALFSLYHFWAPWRLLSRLIFMFPGVWLVWRKKDLRLSIGMHPGTTFVTTTGGVIALLLNLVPL